MAYSIGCANRSPVSLRSITVMICCFTRPFLPVYSSNRSLITNAFTVISVPFLYGWRLFARPRPARVHAPRWFAPVGSRNPGGQICIGISQPEIGETSFFVCSSGGPFALSQVVDLAVLDRKME